MRTWIVAAVLALSAHAFAQEARMGSLISSRANTDAEAIQSARQELFEMERGAFAAELRAEFLLIRARLEEASQRVEALQVAAARRSLALARAHLYLAERMRARMQEEAALRETQRRIEALRVPSAGGTP